MDGSGELVLCYNKGCGQRFNENDNGDEACRYHPGAPVFHDAMKGWSCCKKRSTDFTDFLNMPGCTKGRHNPVKPVEPIRVREKPLEKGEVISVTAPSPPKLKPPAERPSNDLPFNPLKLKVSRSLKTALEKLTAKQSEESNNADSSQPSSDENAEVAIGTKCKHHKCEMEYAGPCSELTDCCYHPGTAIFHEGYKFWTCCRRRTSDWNEFMRQGGCTTGTHVWVEETNKAECRYDWHQTGSVVVVTIFAKCSLPEDCTVEVNPTALRVSFGFEGGKKRYENSWTLFGVVDPARSSTELMAAKVEITLRKADAMGWKYLEYQQPKPVQLPPQKEDDYFI